MRQCWRCASRVACGAEAAAARHDATVPPAAPPQVTLGPKGRNVVLERAYGAPEIVNDGVTIARDIDLECPAMNIGAKLIR